MEYRKIKDDEDKDGGAVAAAADEDIENLRRNNVAALGLGGGGPDDRSKWKRKTVVTLALTFLTSSQAILIVWSKRAGKYEYSVTTANFSVETLKCLLSLAALSRIWKSHGVTEDNRLSTTIDEVIVYPIPAALYLIKNLLQYYIFAYVDAPGYQILKNLNTVSTGVLYQLILKKKLSQIQWAAFILLCTGCTTAQLNPSSDHVLQTPLQGWMMAIIMALLSGFAGVYTEGIFPWILIDYNSHDSQSCIEWHCCIHGDEVCRQHCKGVFYFSGNASDSSCLHFSFWLSSVSCLLSWHNCCLCLDISTLHWEATKIVQCLCKSFIELCFQRKAFP